MQKGIIKEVKEIAKEGKKTFYEVILQDDAKMSTFDAKIKQGESGDTLEFDVAISGKYINLKDGWKLTKQTSSSGSDEKPSHGNGYQMSKGEWAEKQRIERESIEAQVAMKTVLSAQDNGSEDFKQVFNKALLLAEQMIDARLKPAPKTKAGQAESPEGDLEQVEQDIEDLRPQDESPETTALAEPSQAKDQPTEMVPSTPEELYEWLALAKAWKTSTPAHSFLVNKCKISEERIKDNPAGVYHEVKQII